MTQANPTSHQLVVRKHEEPEEPPKNHEGTVCAVCWCHCAPEGLHVIDSFLCLVRTFVYSRSLALFETFLVFVLEE